MSSLACNSAATVCNRKLGNCAHKVLIHLVRTNCLKRGFEYCSCQGHLVSLLEFVLQADVLIWLKMLNFE